MASRFEIKEAMHSDDDTLFAALIARDPSYEGFAYVGVKTTGIFCRLTCPAASRSAATWSFSEVARARRKRASVPACAASPWIGKGR